MGVLNVATLIDGYKLDHRRQYPAHTTRVYSNFTPRSSRVPDQDKVGFFGLQYFLQRYLIDEWRDGFFTQPLDLVLEKYASRVNGYLGPNSIGTDHIKALHQLGYLPLTVSALPEGTLVPLKVPMFTIENTHSDFAWLVNYFETLLSCVVWPMCTSATTALRYRGMLDRYAAETGGELGFVPWQGHDFSFRGMMGPDAAAMSGAGHLLSFTGTDTIPALDLIERYYGPTQGLIGGSVAATEHSVMSAGGELGEKETFERLLDLYPTGIVSVVSDTWNLWDVLTKTLPALKARIMSREGKLVIRPDSGDPVKIICGDSFAKDGDPAQQGVVELLWDLFGGTVTPKGFKVLDPHIGVIYGDSITPERCEAICEGLKAKGFASTNMVFGIGSYTYQYVTRDTYGFAMKATWAEVDGVDRELFKKPATDDGGKFSAKGRLAVHYNGPNKIEVQSSASVLAEASSLLRPVWANGRFVVYWKYDEIRDRLRAGGQALQY